MKLTGGLAYFPCRKTDSKHDEQDLVKRVYVIKN